MTLRQSRWLHVFLMVAFIYGTLGVARDVIRTLNHWGVGQAVEWSLFVLCGGMALWMAYDRYGIRKISNYAAFGILAALYVTAAYEWAGSPAERLHFVEYGVLTILVFRALQGDIRGWPSYGLTVLLVGIFGVLDECIQKFIPSRVFDPKDMLTNFMSGLLAALVIRFVLDGRVGTGYGKKLFD